MRIAIHSKKQFKTEDIEYIVECLNKEFERFTMSRLKWISKPRIESGCITPDFPFGVVFIYSNNNNNNNNNESRCCWQTLSLS